MNMFVKYRPIRYISDWCIEKVWIFQVHGQILDCGKAQVVVPSRCSAVPLSRVLHAVPHQAGNIARKVSFARSINKDRVRAREPRMTRTSISGGVS